MRQRGLSLVINPGDRADPLRPAVPEPVPGPDAALVRQARSGDVDAFAALYQTHRATVFATCLKRLRDRELAEDALQDTFLRAYSSLDRFDERRPLVPWLNAIAVRRCIDIQRRSSRTTTSEDIEDHLPEDPQLDPTIDAVIALEEGGRLQRALMRLHPRQRRALLLYALDGWSYADIASAEGISVASTKSLLFHARANLRRACRRGLLATILLPIRGLRRQLERRGEQIRVRLAMLSDPLLGASGNAVASGIAAIAVAIAVAVPHGALPRPGDSPRESARIGAGAPAASTGRQTLGLVAGPARALSDSANGLGRSLVDPTRGATPEDTVFYSITPSPDYERDKTVFAAGAVPCAQPSCPVLWRSVDGGVNWQRLPARSFGGRTILLPPSYPADSRIFAMGPEGLQMSRDGGAKFKVVLPLEGGAAISPEFAEGDPRILVAHGGVMEYWANRRLAKPAPLVAPAWPELTVAFSPAYATDSTIFLGGAELDERGMQRPVVHRCVASICDSVTLPGASGVPSIRLSPNFETDRRVFAFSFDALLRSTDAGASYASASLPGKSHDALRDFAFVTGRDGREVTYAAVVGWKGTHGGVFRSRDDGATWTGGPIQLAGFDAGVASVVAAADGRLFAAGAGGGIACSSDAGRTWSARCAE